MLFPIGGRCDPHFLFETGAEIILIGITTFQADLLQTHSSRSLVSYTHLDVYKRQYLCNHWSCRKYDFSTFC